MSKKKEALAVAPKETGIVKWSDELAKYAQEASDKEVLFGGQFLSIRGGILSLAGQPMKGNEINVVVLKDIFENTYFPNKYDPDNTAPPECYAYGDTDKDMKPHEKAPNPQSESCSTCEWNQWKSRGEGKACQNRRRLAIIPAGDLTPEGVAKAEVAYFRLPVTSGRLWGMYVKGLATTSRIPPFAAITNIKVVPDSKTQVKVHFHAVDPIPEASLPAVMERMREQTEAIRFPYPEAKEETKPARPKPTRKF